MVARPRRSGRSCDAASRELWWHHRLEPDRRKAEGAGPQGWAPAALTILKKPRVMGSRMGSAAVTTRSIAEGRCFARFSRLGKLRVWGLGMGESVWVGGWVGGGGPGGTVAADTACERQASELGCMCPGTRQHPAAPPAAPSCPAV